MASPNLSRASGSTSAAPGSGSTPSLSEHTETETRPTDIKAPLWNHVTILEKAKPGGGNVLWKCNYCPFQKSSSYTRVELHLLQKKGKGIATCPNVTFEMLSQMRNEVARCKELVERQKAQTVSLPTAPAPSSSNLNKKNKRGPLSALEKSWALADHKLGLCTIVISCGCAQCVLCCASCNIMLL